MQIPRRPERVGNQQAELQQLSRDQVRQLHLRIGVLGLTGRLRVWVRYYRVRYVGELVQKTRAEVRAWKNVGKTSVRKLEAKLAERDLSLGMDIPGFDPEQVPESVLPKGEDIDWRYFEPVHLLTEVHPRVRTTLRRLSLNYVGDIVARTEMELTDVGGGPGKQGMSTVRTALENRGLRVGDACEIPGLNIEKLLNRHLDLLDRAQRTTFYCQGTGVSWAEGWKATPAPPETGRRTGPADDPRLCEPVEVLGLSLNMQGRVKRKGIECLGDLVRMTPQRLRDLPGIGPGILRAVQEGLARKGLKLGMQLPGFAPDDEYLRVRRGHAEWWREQFGWSWEKAWSTFPEKEALKTTDLRLLLPVESLDIQRPAARAFRQVGLRTLGDVATSSEKNLENAARVGAMVVHGLRIDLKRMGYELGQEIPDYHPDDVPAPEKEGMAS